MNILKNQFNSSSIDCVTIWRAKQQSQLMMNICSINDLHSTKSVDKSDTIKLATICWSIIGFVRNFLFRTWKTVNHDFIWRIKLVLRRRRKEEDDKKNVFYHLISWLWSLWSVCFILWINNNCNLIPFSAFWVQFE